MSSVPKGRADRVQFYESHVNSWVERAEEIGVDPELAAALASQTSEARDAFRQQQQALSAARAATLKFNNAVDRMRKTGSNVLAQIGLQANKAGGGVYSLALISAPKKKSPTAPPGQPFAFEFQLDAIGALALSWKCDNPRNAEGTTYHIHRRTGTSGPFVYLGFAGKKKFVDKTLPQGLTTVMYQIQATRSKSKGDVARFDVTFGTGRTAPPQPTQSTATDLMRAALRRAA